MHMHEHTHVHSHILMCVHAHTNIYTDLRKDSSKFSFLSIKLGCNVYFVGDPLGAK